MNRWLVLFAALQGAMAIAMAALGAHAGGGGIVTTASTMQLVHAAGAMAAPLALPTRWGRVAGWVLLTGALCFAGALYVSGFALGTLGPVAPIGGIAMIAGWLILAVGALLRKAPARS